ncbi:MAG: hypothetical protein A2474_03635 [Elusimicrobia bacterium RIFOXYC2_FULL_34_12]|nr:MAG: hypothetical protein A2474_03635 [Elusimicrobia bacterium RIFOXYC2_FULL_34_12]HAM38773.1 phosphohydrolase [Elusimicrobiota bacterium]
MVSINDIKNYLKVKLSKKRYIHTLNILELSVRLAAHNGIKEIEKIKIAALLHDCKKDIGNGNNHSFLAYNLAKKKFKIKDIKILNAIKNHTYGHRNMDDFSKIIYIADMSEPSRKFKEAKQIRRLAFKDLDKAMFLAVATKIKYVLKEMKPISMECIILYNKLLKRQGIENSV